MPVDSLPANEEQLASAQHRSQLFWLLAEAVLLGPWTDSWATVMKQAATAPAATADDGELADAWREMLGALAGSGPATRDRLAAEHTRLFGGLQEGYGPPPPYESVWRGHDEPAAVTMSVLQTYAAAGFADIDNEAGPQDHLGVELKFMAILALQELEARQRHDLTTVTARVDQQRRFLHRHLGQWMPAYLDAMLEKTGEPLYRALGRLLLAALPAVSADLAATY